MLEGVLAVVELIAFVFEAICDIVLLRRGWKFSVALIILVVLIIAAVVFAVSTAG